MKVYYGKAKTAIVFGGGALAWSVFVHKKVHFSGSACVHYTGRSSQIFLKIWCVNVSWSTLDTYNFWWCCPQCSAFYRVKGQPDRSKFAKMLIFPLLYCYPKDFIQTCCIGVWVVILHVGHISVRWQRPQCSDLGAMSHYLYMIYRPHFLSDFIQTCFGGLLGGGVILRNNSFQWQRPHCSDFYRMPCHISNLSKWGVKGRVRGIHVLEGSPPPCRVPLVIPIL